MSDVASCSSGPRASRPLHDHERAGRPRSQYEPIIVTTLRRYVRRGAPSSLLRRIAGGAGHWRAVNETWDIDGTAQLLDGAVPRRRRMVLDENLPELSTAERRILLEQLAEECVQIGASFPSPHRLGKYFGCDPRSILNDLRWMRVAEYPQGGLSRAARLDVARVSA